MLFLPYAAFVKRSDALDSGRVHLLGNASLMRTRACAIQLALVAQWRRRVLSPALEVAECTHTSHSKRTQLQRVTIVLPVIQLELNPLITMRVMH